MQYFNLCYIRYLSGDFLKARQKVAKAELTSNLESEDEDDHRLRKRKIIKKSESESSDEDEEVISRKRQKLSKPNPKPKPRKNLFPNFPAPVTPLSSGNNFE